jgi:hypothetical protein
MKIVLYALLSLVSLAFTWLGQPQVNLSEAPSHAAPLATLALVNTAAR